MITYRRQDKRTLHFALNFERDLSIVLASTTSPEETSYTMLSHCISSKRKESSHSVLWADFEDCFVGNDFDVAMSICTVWEEWMDVGGYGSEIAHDVCAHQSIGKVCFYLTSWPSPTSIIWNNYMYTKAFPRPAHKASILLPMSRLQSGLIFVQLMVCLKAWTNVSVTIWRPFRHHKYTKIATSGTPPDISHQGSAPRME